MLHTVVVVSRPRLLIRKTHGWERSTLTCSGRPFQTTDTCFASEDIQCIKLLGFFGLLYSSWQFVSPSCLRPPLLRKRQYNLIPPTQATSAPIWRIWTAQVLAKMKTGARDLRPCVNPEAPTNSLVLMCSSRPISNGNFSVIYCLVRSRQQVSRGGFPWALQRLTIFRTV